MPEMRHRIEIIVPQGTLVVRNARCPNGCGLMDREHPIHGHPSIRVRAAFGNVSGEVFLDPVYGSYDNISEIIVPRGQVAEFHCPHCGVALTDVDRRCAKCAAPVFTLGLPRGGSIEVCQRNGCPDHRMQIVSGEQAMQRVFDEIGMDAFL